MDPGQWHGDLGTLSGGEIGSSLGYGVSADGRTIVGSASGNVGSRLGDYAFRWTEEAGMVALEPYSTRTIPSNAAYRVSDNGLWTVGEGEGVEGIEAVLWDPQGKARGLGTLIPDVYTRAFGVSNDGRVVVGECGGANPFVWTAATGMRPLRDVMADYGFDLDATGWTMYSITGISTDGQWMSANGLGPNGAEACLIYLPIPAPASTLVFGVCCGATLIRRRR